MRNFILLILISIFQLSSYAEVESISTKTLDGIELTGTHYAVKNGRPLLLIHGFMENINYWASSAKLLQEEGYDVYLFNMRGHGVYERKSMAKESTPGMGFDEIVAYDIPAMVDFVYKQSGKQKLVIVGHSMGTMSSRLALNGLGFEDEVFTQSDRKKQWMLERLSGIIAFGSPSGFEYIDPILKRIYLMGPEDLLSFKKRILQFILTSEAVESDSIWSSMLDRIARSSLISNFLKSLMNVDNLSTHNNELSKLLSEAMSVPHQDLYDDIYRWGVTGVYGSRNNTYVYKNMKIGSELPYVLIGASEDKIANPKEIIEDFRSQGANQNLCYIHIENFGHLDLVFGEKGTSLVSEIINTTVTNNFEFDSIKKIEEKFDLKLYKDATELD